MHKYSDPLLSNLLKRLWQQLVLSLLGYDATSLAHLYLGSSSHLFSADPFKLRQVGWGASLHSYFQVSPEMFDRALAGPLKDIQRLVPKPLLHCLGCMLRVVVLLEGKPSPQSEVLSALEQFSFYQGSLCTLLRSSLSRS